MTTFNPVSLPTWNRRAGASETLRQIDTWLTSPPMRALVAAFGATLDAALLPGTLQRLAEFTAEKWDFRQGSERDEVKEIHFDADLRQLITSAASALGLADPSPPRRSAYDTILILGGLVRACVVRPRYAAQLVRGGLNVHEIAALGAFRNLSKGERKIAADLDISATDEFTAMTEGVKNAFGPYLKGSGTVSGLDLPGDIAHSWRTITWPVENQSNVDRVSIVAAPTYRAGAERANTTDTYQFWASRLKERSFRSVLVVTHPVYVPYQGCAAIESLGLEYDLDVETVGVSRDAADLGASTQKFGPQEYLQEIGAGIGAMVHLRSSLMSRNGRS
jgi:hypothetical protein